MTAPYLVKASDSLYTHGNTHTETHINTLTCTQTHTHIERLT